MRLGLAENSVYIRTPKSPMDPHGLKPIFSIYISILGYPQCNDVVHIYIYTYNIYDIYIYNI